MESYWKIGMAFLRAFRALGLQAEVSTRRSRGRPRSPLCFSSHSYGEITVNGKKIIGSAQRRWPDGFLQQGSIPLEIFRPGLMRVFRGDGRTGGDSMAGLRELMPGLNPASLRHAVTEAFEGEFGIAFKESGPGPCEDTLTRNLLESRYLRAEWNYFR
jgi:lipoate-protein ligase A